jgi:hypothetical protein
MGLLSFSRMMRIVFIGPLIMWSGRIFTALGIKSERRMIVLKDSFEVFFRGDLQPKCDAVPLSRTIPSNVPNYLINISTLTMALGLEYIVLNPCTHNKILFFHYPTQS